MILSNKISLLMSLGFAAGLGLPVAQGQDVAKQSPHTFLDVDGQAFDIFADQEEILNAGTDDFKRSQSQMSAKNNDQTIAMEKEWAEIQARKAKQTKTEVAKPVSSAKRLKELDALKRKEDALRRKIRKQDINPNTMITKEEVEWDGLH